MTDLRGALEDATEEQLHDLLYGSDLVEGHEWGYASPYKPGLRALLDGLAALSVPVGDEGRAVVLAALKDAIGAQAARDGYSRAWDRNVFIACADATFRLDTGPVADAILAALSQPSPDEKGRRADKDALASASARTVEQNSSGSEGGGE